MATLTLNPAFPAHTPKIRTGLLTFVWATIILLATLDFTTHGINVATIYTIPIFFAAQVLRFRTITLMCILLVVLSFAGIFIGPKPTNYEFYDLVRSFRMFNRTLASAAICSTALLICNGRTIRRRTFAKLKERQFSGEDERIYLDLVQRLETQRTILISLIVIVSMAVTDFMSPREVNLPILYAVPLMLCATSRSIRAIWIMLPILLLLAWTGFFYGPASATGAVNPTIPHLLVINRIVATLVMVALATIATVWVIRNPDEAEVRMREIASPTPFRLSDT